MAVIYESVHVWETQIGILQSDGASCLQFALKWFRKLLVIISVYIERVRQIGSKCGKM